LQVECDWGGETKRDSNRKWYFKEKWYQSSFFYYIKLKSSEIKKWRMEKLLGQYNTTSICKNKLTLIIRRTQKFFSGYNRKLSVNDRFFWNVLTICNSKRSELTTIAIRITKDLVRRFKDFERRFKDFWRRNKDFSRRLEI